MSFYDGTRTGLQISISSARLSDGYIALYVQYLICLARKAGFRPQFLAGDRPDLNPNGKLSFGGTRLLLLITRFLGLSIRYLTFGRQWPRPAGIRDRCLVLHNFHCILAACMTVSAFSIS